MKPSQKRLFKKLIEGLERDPAPLSNNRGRMERTTSPITNKDRRHSGRVTFFSDDPDYPTQGEFWDEWISHKDGQRDKSNIIKNIYPSLYWYDEEFWDKRKEIEKIKKRESIRKVRKIKDAIKKRKSFTSKKRS